MLENSLTDVTILDILGAFQTKGWNMQHLFIFITHHWLAVTVLIILLIALIWLESKGKVSGNTRLNPQQTVQLINREHAVVFDTRAKDLFSQGHIAGAIHMPETTLTNKDLHKYKDKQIILVCSNGTHAPKLGSKLKQQGLTKLYFLQGGMAAWSTANLPTVK